MSIEVLSDIILIYGACHDAGPCEEIAAFGDLNAATELCVETAPPRGGSCGAERELPVELCRVNLCSGETRDINPLASEREGFSSSGSVSAKGATGWEIGPKGEVADETVCRLRKGSADLAQPGLPIRGEDIDAVEEEE